MKRYDAIVAGAGISGCSSAISLADKNKDVAVFEMKECVMTPGSYGFWVIDAGHLSREMSDRIPPYIKEIVKKCAVMSYDELMFISPFGKRYFLKLKNYVVDRTKMQHELTDILLKKGIDVYFGSKVRAIGKKKVHTAESSYTADDIICACGSRAVDLDIYRKFPESACVVTAYIHRKFEIPPSFFIGTNFPGGVGFVIPRESGMIAGAVLRRGAIFYNPSYFFYYFLKRLDVYDRSMGRMYGAIFLPENIMLRNGVKAVGLSAGHSSFLNGIYTSAISGDAAGSGRKMETIRKIILTSWKSLSLYSKSNLASAVGMRLFSENMAKKIIMLNSH